ncbi:DNA-primase RepB domain-containing protein [Pseudorhodobacter wandonensis]|uniref:DNA-primase RepB domain-containing protein n=1 Tax=Pseudorhodobacter wandonensis TaxID=1120568 RepID=UPI0018CFD984|nr:DNA-primase RepB domain-containing protein [Pseudorhodobacter wandonensis]
MAEYVYALFGEWAVKGQVWTAGMPTVEGANREWFGAGGLDHLSTRFPDMKADMYMAIGVMDPAAKARGNRNVVAQPLLIVDDIGTKIDPKKWDALFAVGMPQPTAKIETSPGNQTWIWSLAGDAKDPQRWVDLACVRAWLVDMGLTDDVMDVARYVRLPGGWNSKKKYCAGNGGQPVGVSLVDWNECRSELGGTRVNLDDIGWALMGTSKWVAREFPATAGGRSQANSAALGGMLGAGALVRSADLSKPDALMKLAEAIGMGLVQIRPGVVEAPCPNIAAHGDRAETGFAFLGEGLMHCNHASCQELSTRDFRGMMEAEFDRQAAAAVGGEIEGCRTGIGFLARASFPVEDAAVIEVVTAPMTAKAVARIEKEDAERGKRKRAAHLIAAQFMEEKGMVPFLDPKGGVWVWVEGRLRNIKTTAGFRPLLGWLSQHGLDITGAARNNLIETLEGRAATQPMRDVFFRVANGGSGSAPEIYVNLMDDAGRAVVIDGKGWRIVPVAELPLPLAHRDGGLPLPPPVSAKDGLSFMDRLERHIPLTAIVAKNNPKDLGVQQRAILFTFIVAQFARNGAVAHLLLAGEQGGGKTTMARRLNGLTDPDVGAVQSRLPTEPTAIFAMVSQLSNFVLDNTSGVRAEQADTLCVLATGSAHATRKLYTDGERSLSSALCSVIFTSVLDDGITRRADLQDRILTLTTSPLEKNRRKSEGELNAAWAADLPHLLADLFDLLSVGLRSVDSVRGAQNLGLLPPPPRFADVAQLAEAAAWLGLGWPMGLLTTALNAARADAAEGQLSDNPAAFRLRALLLAQPGGFWRGSYDELERAIAFVEGGPAWGPHRGRVRDAIARVKGPLRDLWGITHQEVGRTKHARIQEFRIAADAEKKSEKG